jgi:hypothetical protein
MVQITPEQDPVEVIVKGAVFSEPAKRLMSKAIPSTITYFDEVRCLCPGDEEPRQINHMVFKLKE